MVEYFRNALILLQQLPEPIFFLHLFIALITLCIIRYLLIPLFTSQLTKRRKDWARVFSQYSPFAQLQYIVPLLLIDDGMSSLAFYPSIVKYLEIAIVVSSIFLIRATLKTGGGIYRLYPIAKRYPITSYIELASLVTYILGGLIVFSLLLDKSPIYLLSGLGALTAVLMLIFQNTIKSFIAGVQIGSSNLIQEEDWIEIPSLGVNGNVISVKLHFIEVRNWDNTTLIVPTYKIIDGSFKNWRSVFALGARRIVTSINIDHSTVQTLTKTQAHKLMNHAEL